MTRHIEFVINGDFTTWAEDREDFQGISKEALKEELIDYLIENINDFFPPKIKKIWYENN